MPSTSIPNKHLETFSSNRRLAVGTAITFVHASVVVLLLFEDLSRWRFLAYTITPSLVTGIIPYLITRIVIEQKYEDQSLISYLETLSENTKDSTPIAAEVQLSQDVIQQLPDDVSDPDSVKIVDEEVLDHVKGEEFDPVDADARGIVAIGFACSLIVVSAPIVGVLIGGVIPVSMGLLFALVASAVVLQQHRDMIDVIEYTSKSVEP